jgi:hypothetical protein
VRRFLVPAIRPYVWFDPGWFAWLEFGPGNPDATVTAIGKRVVSELGGRFEEYHPNDPNEGTEYYLIFVGKMRLGLTSKNGIVDRIGSYGLDIPLLLRVAELYGAERRGWRWPLYWVRQRLFGSRQDAAPGTSLGVDDQVN